MRPGGGRRRRLAFCCQDWPASTAGRAGLWNPWRMLPSPSRDGIPTPLHLQGCRYGWGHGHAQRAQQRPWQQPRCPMRSTRPPTHLQTAPAAPGSRGSWSATGRLARPRPRPPRSSPIQSPTRGAAGPAAPAAPTAEAAGRRGSPLFANAHWGPTLREDPRKKKGSTWQGPALLTEANSGSAQGRRSRRTGSPRGPPALHSSCKEERPALNEHRTLYLQVNGAGGKRQMSATVR